MCALAKTVMNETRLTPKPAVQRLGAITPVVLRVERPFPEICQGDKTKTYMDELSLIAGYGCHA